jgi:2,4-dienoyl-CoA reductase-like NADH-dependent reductase (Old Yellow Enzyme family)
MPRLPSCSGPFEHRTHLLFAVIKRLRVGAEAGFQIGVRLSPERFGITLEEARLLAG